MPTGSCLWPLQVGIHGLLSVNAALLAFLGSTEAAPQVFDEVPENTDHEYVVHGDAQEVDDDTMGRGQRIVDFAIEHWSNYRGSKRCKQACDLIIQAINDASPSVTGYVVTKIVFVRTIIQRQGNDSARWGAAWFRAWMQEA